MKDMHVIETADADARDQLLALAETTAVLLILRSPAALRDYIRRQIIEIIRDEGGSVPGANRRNER